VHILIVIDTNCELNLCANLFFPKVYYFSHVFLKVLTTVHAKFGWNPPLRLKQIGFRWLLPHVATRCIDSFAVAEEGYHRCG